MRHLLIFIFAVITLTSCTEKKSSSLKGFDNLKKQIANDTTTTKKLLHHYDSLKSLYGDSLTYVSDIYTNKINTFKRVEDRIIDTIIRLKEVKDRAEYVRRQTNGQRHLAYTIWQKPTQKQLYYWVKVLEDNGVSRYTHFNFYIKPKPFQIFYYDTLKDTTLDLNSWRKGLKP